MLVNKLFLRRLIIEAILHEATKQTLISKNPGLDKYEKHLNTVESKYHSWLGGLFDEYRQKNSDISYGSIIFLALMHQKYAKTNLLPMQYKDFKRLNLEQTVNAIQDIGAQYTDSSLYNELISIDKKENLAKIPEEERQEQIAVTKDNTKVASGLTLLKTIYDSQKQPQWQIFYPETAEGSQKIGVESWCTVYSDAFSNYWNQGIRLYYVLAYDPAHETEGYGYNYSEKPYAYISLGMRPKEIEQNFDVYGDPVGEVNLDIKNSELVLDGEDQGVSVFGNQQGVDEGSLKNVLKQFYDNVVGFIVRHHKAVSKLQTTQKDISGRDLPEKYAETRAKVLRVFKREIRAMNPNDSFKMIKDVLMRISTREKGALDAGQRQVRDYIFEKYLVRVDTKMQKTDVYQKGRYNLEICASFLNSCIDSDEKQIEYVIELANKEGFLDNMAVGLVDDSPLLQFFPFWDNENLTDRTIEIIEDKVTPVIDVWKKELTQVEFIDDPDADEDDPNDNRVIPNPDHFFSPSNIQQGYFNTILTHINHPTVNRVFMKSFELGKYDEIIDYVIKAGYSSRTNFNKTRTNPRQPMSYMFVLVKKIVSTVERTTPDASVYYDQYRNKSYKMVGFPTSVSRLLLDSSISAIRNMKFDELFSGYNRRDLCFRHLWDSEYLMGRRDRVGYPVRKQIDSDSPEIDFTPKEKAGMRAEMALKILETLYYDFAFYFYNTEGAESTRKLMDEVRKYEKIVIDTVTKYGQGDDGSQRSVRTILLAIDELEIQQNEVALERFEKLLINNRSTPGGLSIVKHKIKNYIEKYILQPYEPGKQKGPLQTGRNKNPKNQYSFQDSCDRIVDLEDLLNIDVWKTEEDEFIRDDLINELSKKCDHDVLLMLAREDRETFKRMFIAGSYHHTPPNVQHLSNSFNTKKDGSGRKAPGEFVRFMFGMADGITGLWKSGYIVDEQDALKLHSEVLKCIDELPTHLKMGGPYYKLEVAFTQASGGGLEEISRNSLIIAIKSAQEELDFDANLD